MRFFWPLLFVLLNAGFGKCSESIDLGQPVMEHRQIAIQFNETTTASTDVNITTEMTPVMKAQYIMNLNSTHSAILGSTIIFEAELIPNATVSETNSFASVRFTYVWMNTACKKQVRTVDGLNSSISLSFLRKHVNVGDYLMTVAAYQNDDPSILVAFVTRKFTLTKTLNGILTLTQNLDYQRYPDTFSTIKSVTLIAQVQDIFLQSDLSYEYFWYRDSRSLATTKQPNYTTTFSDPFSSSMAAVISIYPTSQRLTNTVVEGSSNGSSVEPGIDTLDKTRAKLENIQDYPPFVYSGTFEKTVAFKDPMNDCVLTRMDTDPKDKAISIEKIALVNITCTGSPPSSVCINITSHNSSLPMSHACMPTSFVYKLEHIVQVRLTSKGWKDVHFLVYNDISRYHLIESFYGYSPDTFNVPVLIVPIVFGVLGILVVLMSGVYIMRLRKKPNIEVADFDFHPSLTHRQSEGRFNVARLANTIRSSFSRDPDERTDSKWSLLRKKAPNVPSYEFYESL